MNSVVYVGIYKLGSDGLYHYSEGKDLVLISMKDYKKDIEGTEHFFCYDNKEGKFYYYTNNAIAYYWPQVKWRNNEFLKEMKQNGIKKIKVKDVGTLIDPIMAKMDAFYREKNDSIIAQRKIEEEQRIKDSLAAEQRKKEERELYRQNHDWHSLKLKNNTLMYCKFCEDSHFEQDMSVFSLSSDTIYYLRKQPDMASLGQALYSLHFAKIPNGLKTDAGFKDYIAIWQDSIANHNNMSNAEAVALNMHLYVDFRHKLRSIAPVGFIQDWGWDLNTADGIEPHFSFFNTSDKVVKYVEFFFNIYNAVGDKCILRYNNSYTGSVKGVGPVDSFEVGSWNWDRATHYTSGDASEMKITKVIVTYMDGSTKALTGNMIKYDY